ncbi:reverse transcriptase domain-containing protein [Tanacetum coccineum]
MADNRTMAQMLQAPIEGYEDAIVVPPINANNFELKQPLINLVQSNKFTGRQDPHNHLRFFNKVTSTFRHPEVPNTSVKLLLFPFSLDGEARDWLDKEPPRSILTWDDLVSKFINQYFPPSKTTYYRNEIITFYQKPNETFNEAWERFKGLLRQCPHHGFSELHQLDTFYNSLNSNDQDALDSAAGGNFLDKMPQEGLAIIESKSKVRYSRSRANDSRMSTDAPLSNSSLSNNSFDMQQIAASLEDKMTIKMNQMMNQMKALVVTTPAPVKAVEEMYSGSPTIQSNDSFPSSSPMKTRDSAFEEFTDEFTLPNSLPPGDDVSILKKEFHEVNFQVYSNPLFEFDESFKSSNINPLFEEHDKDVEIKSSSSFTLTSPEESEFEAYLEIDSIPPGIDLTLPPTLEVSSSNPTSPTLTGEKVFEEIKEKEVDVSIEIPIDTIVMPIRITFDNPIDFNDHFSKPKDLKKDLPISFDSTTTSILPHPSLDSDSPFTAELSASVTLNSLGNEDKVFKPGILVYHAIHDKNLVTLEENLKENISSGTLLVFKEPSILLPTPEPPDECLKNVVLNFYQSKKMFPLHVEDTFAFIIWTFLPFFTYTKASPMIFSFQSENFVFDPGIITFHNPAAVSMKVSICSP